MARRAIIVDPDSTAAPPARGRAAAAAARNGACALSEKRCFEFDRSVVARNLRDLWQNMADAAANLGLVSVEGVFRPELASEIAARAAALVEEISRLKSLEMAVSRAPFVAQEEERKGKAHADA